MIYTQKELYEELKNNPLNVDVFIEQDTIPKKDNFILVSRISDDGMYADDGVYNYTPLIRFQIYAKDVDDYNQLIKWFREKFNALLQSSDRKDFYYIAAFEKAIKITDW